MPGPFNPDPEPKTLFSTHFMNHEMTRGCLFDEASGLVLARRACSTASTGHGTGDRLGRRVFLHIPAERINSSESFSSVRFIAPCAQIHDKIMKTPVPSEDRSAIEVARINARQVILVTIITAVAGIAGAMIQGVFSSGKIDSLNTQLTTSHAEVEVIGEALYRLTSNYIESYLFSTSRPEKAIAARQSGISESEFSYRRLRQAIFFNIDVLRANGTILEKTLGTLSQRGHNWIAPQKARILADFPEILATRLRWLEDEAIPALDRATREQNPVMQQVPTAKVPLPEGIQILTASNPAEVPVHNMAALREEVELIKRSLPARGQQ